MRTTKAVLSSLALAGLFLLTILTAAMSQDRSPADVLREARQEWSNLARRRTEFEVSSPELLPSALRLAAEQSGCGYRDGFQVAPARFFSKGSNRLALVSCWRMMKATQRAFDLSDLQKPAIVRIPILGYPDGIGTSVDAPGFLTRDAATGLFHAETTSDMVGTTRGRYTYRYDAPANFVMLRVEIQKDGVGDWITIWDTPKWSSFAIAN